MNESIKAIQDSIESLSVYTELGNQELNEEISFAKEKLYEALNSSNKFDDKETFSAYVMEDSDPISSSHTEVICDLDSFVEKVREIQNDIIDEFVEFEVAYKQ